MSLLNIKHLSVFFTRKENKSFQAVNDVNLSIDEGEILGIVGETGSGKSVTALSILGLLPYPKAYHGKDSSIIFKNQELINMDNDKFRHIRGNEIAFIFQEPMSSLNPLHKIGHQIAESIALHQKLSDAEIKKQTLELLKIVKIPNPEQKINAYPYELSGGQRQRVMIAMAIANKPKILIADEPTTALDVTIQEQIIDLLLKGLPLSIIAKQLNIEQFDLSVIIKQLKRDKYITSSQINDARNKFREEEEKNILIFLRRGYSQSDILKELTYLASGTLSIRVRDLVEAGKITEKEIEKYLSEIQNNLVKKKEKLKSILTSSKEKISGTVITMPDQSQIDIVTPCIAILYMSLAI